MRAAHREVRGYSTPEPAGVWLKWCGTVGKPGGNGENKHQPTAPGETSLLDNRLKIMKKILFIEFWNCTPHIETALELAKNHSDAGDQVTFLFCGHDTPYQEGLSLSAREAGFLTTLPELKGIELIGSSRIKFSPRCKLENISYNRPFRFNNIDELMGFKYKNFEAGLAVASSLVSRIKHSEPDLRKYEQDVYKMLDSTIKVYEFSKKCIAEETPDLVYVFNGRFCNQRAVMRAAIELDVEIRIHERGASKFRYTANPFMPHDEKRTQQVMLAQWERCSGTKQSRDDAQRFFEERREGQEQGWKSFNVGQKKNMIPKIDSSKKTVTYFSSSDDEFVASGNAYEWTDWKNQFEAVLCLIKLCKNNNIQLFIRLHPHLQEKSIEDQQKWLSLSSYEDVELIAFDSPVDTYAMIENSDIVVTFGSTVGIEAVYWGKPSITLGPSYYSDIGATYQPRSDLELNRLLVSSDLKVDRERALPYGLYMATFGHRFSYYVPHDLFSGEFLGHDLQKKSVTWRAVRKLENLKNRIFQKCKACKLWR